MNISLRPVSADDEDFLYRLYASIRAQELVVVPWSAEKKEAFLRQQFAAQHLYHHEHFADADFAIIMKDGLSIGRLYIARWGDEIRLVDVALLPEHRRNGIGSRLLTELFAESDASGRPVRVLVEFFNPAIRLYERLGFRQVEEKGVYIMLERSPVTSSVPVDGRSADAGP